MKQSMLFTCNTYGKHATLQTASKTVGTPMVLFAKNIQRQLKIHVSPALVSHAKRSQSSGRRATEDERAHARANERHKANSGKQTSIGSERRAAAGGKQMGPAEIMGSRTAGTRLNNPRGGPALCNRTTTSPKAPTYTKRASVRRATSHTAERAQRRLSSQAKAPRAAPRSRACMLRA